MAKTISICVYFLRLIPPDSISPSRLKMSWFIPLKKAARSGEHAAIFLSGRYCSLFSFFRLPLNRAFFTRINLS